MAKSAPIVKSKHSAKPKKGTAEANPKKVKKGVKKEKSKAKAPEPSDDEGEEEEEEDEEDEEEDEEAIAERERIKEEKAAKRRALAEKYAIVKPKKLAKQRGYRLLARRAGFSGARPAHDQSKDVAQNIISLGETKRACRWKPCMPEESAYGNLDEFKLRCALSEEPLLPGAAGVFRHGTEVFVRNVTYQAMQMAFDMGETGITTASMAATLRPLQRVLRFSFEMPHGLVRYSQTCGVKGKELPMAGDDDADIESEIAGVQSDQAEHAANLLAKQQEKRDARKAAKQAAKAAKAK